MMRREADEAEQLLDPRASRAAPVARPWSASGSASISPTVMRGLSEA